MKITKAEVEHLAKLARLQLSTSEKDKYSQDLGKVLTYVDKLREFGEIRAEENNILSNDASRPDKISVWPNPLELLSLAPKQRDNLIEVPAVFERKDEI
jgi:aspartyl-tRNA(Asn)/glutamyl-tRNA(Gln) amidotransferase subunit C